MRPLPKRLVAPRSSARRIEAVAPPALLRDYMDGRADIVRELEARYHAPPLMSLFRPASSRDGERSAVLGTQDGAATMTVVIDRADRLEWTFRLGSMLGQRFELRDLSELDRERWLEILREAEAEPAFLWSAARWSQDYLICSAHRYYTNIFAFAPRHAEAAARLTPEAARRLLDWLQQAWSAPDEPTALSW